jgi:hypothetical protein
MSQMVRRMCVPAGLDVSHLLLLELPSRWRRDRDGTGTWHHHRSLFVLLEWCLRKDDRTVDGTVDGTVELLHRSSAMW